MFKKVIIGTLVTGFTLFGTGNVFAAESSSLLKQNSIHQDKTEIFTKNKVSNVSRVSENKNLYYQFENLERGESIITKNTFTINSKQNVNLTLVQWTDLFSTAPTMKYQIIDSNEKNIGDSVELKGEYKSENITIGFKNIPAGTYKIKITNVSGGYMAHGNGYTVN
ncbi:hypothetical protein PDM89_26220 [Bacillus cereus]|nr:hypothetical protein [Bacillus cereus]